MKEKITIEIGKTNNGNAPKSNSVTNKISGQHLSALKRNTMALLHAADVKLHKDSSAISKLGIAVRKYRFGLAITGLVFMLIFRNDNTKAIGLEPNSKEEAALSAGTDKGFELAETEQPKQKSNKKKTIAEKPKNQHLEKGEAQKTYHIPNIPELSSKKRTLSDLQKNSDMALDAYLNKYAKLAKEESAKFKIPASVLLGLALLNSEYGYAALAKEANNHFGIRCSENTVPMGKGMKSQLVKHDNCYTVYESVWASYRSQIKMIVKVLKKSSSKGDANHLFVIKKLEDAAYFEQRGFSADDLQQIIEENNLKRFDN